MSPILLLAAACALAPIQPADKASDVSHETAGATTFAPRQRYSKPSAAIDVIPQRVDIVDVGVRTPIEITLLPHQSADDATVEFLAGDGLTLSNAQNPAILAALKPSIEYRIALEVSAARSGVHYLGVLVKLREGQSIQTKAVSIRVVVGPAPSNTQAAKPTSQGAIIEMPANEELRK
jgi:hypothetical protein